MTTERNQDPDATVEMPRIKPSPEVDEELEEIDPDKTLVREDWESKVIRRVAPRLAEVEQEFASKDEPFGWESEGLRRLSRVVREQQ